MSINSFFDKIYCINLEHRVDRWQQSLCEFEKHKLDVQRFNAFTGDNFYAPHQIFLRKGEVGLINTHIAILNDAILNNYQNILILEDDIEFSENANEIFDEAVKDVPNFWDILYLGGNYTNATVKSVSDNLNMVSSVLTTHAIGFNQKCYNKALEKMNYVVPVDVTYSNLQHLVFALGISPSIAFQREGYSDIVNQHVDYNFLRN